MLRLLLLGLLGQKPRYGYELKAVFEELLGGTWPLNPGQVYATLGKLEADGLITAEVVPQELLPDRKVYSVTAAGQQELKRWTEEAVDGPVKLRDELFLKVIARGLVDRDRPTDLLWKQREAHMRALARMHRLRADPSLHPATALLLDGAILRTEADLKWLDLCEERLPEVGT